MKFSKKFSKTLGYFKKISVAFKLLDYLDDIVALIDSAVNKEPIKLGDFPYLVYSTLPKKWKTPIGPCSWPEFEKWIKDGLLMFQK